MGEAIELRNFPHSVGDEPKFQLKQEYFHEDDQDSARLICMWQVDLNQDVPKVQHINKEAGEVTFESGGRAARLVVSKLQYAL